MRYFVLLWLLVLVLTSSFTVQAEIQTSMEQEVVAPGIVDCEMNDLNDVRVFVDSQVLVAYEVSPHFELTQYGVNREILGVNYLDYFLEVSQPLNNVVSGFKLYLSTITNKRNLRFVLRCCRCHPVGHYEYSLNLY